MPEKVTDVMQDSCGLQQLTGELAPQVVETQTGDSGAAAGVPPCRLGTPDPLPRRRLTRVRGVPLAGELLIRKQGLES